MDNSKKLSLFGDCGCSSENKSWGLSDVALPKNNIFGTEISKINLRGGDSTYKQNGFKTACWAYSSLTGGGVWTQCQYIWDTSGPANIIGSGTNCSGCGNW